VRERGGKRLDGGRFDFEQGQAMSISLLSRLRAATLAGLLAFAPAAMAQQGGGFSEEQKQAIGAVVRDYLLKHPELLQEVMAELEKRQAEQQKIAQAGALKESRQTLLNAPHSIVAGNLQGDVTLVEFFDYNCGYCKRALADVRALAKSDSKLRIVLKDFPVLGPESVEASRVSLAVKNQLQGEKLFDYHIKVMESRGRVNGERALSVAKEMGVDIARVQKDMDAPDVRAALQENVGLGDKLGLTGTPAFIIGDEIIPGAVGIEPLRQVVASVRKCGKASC
jgi:protein-disulfide isomerase